MGIEMVLTLLLVAYSLFIHSQYCHGKLIVALFILFIPKVSPFLKNSSHSMHVPVNQ